MATYFKDKDGNIVMQKIFSSADQGDFIATKQQEIENLEDLYKALKSQQLDVMNRLEKHRQELEQFIMANK